MNIQSTDTMAVCLEDLKAAHLRDGAPSYKTRVDWRFYRYCGVPFSAENG